MIRCLLLLILLLLPASVMAQGAPATLDTYQTWLRTAYAASTRADRIGLDQVATQLVATTSVQLPDGTAVAVDQRWLANSLQQEPPDYDQITGRIGALLDTLAQPSTAPPGDAQQRLDAIMNRAPFNQPDVLAPVRELLERFLDWLFGRLPAGIPAPSAFGQLTLVGWLVLGVGLALVLSLLIYALRGVRSSVRQERSVHQAAHERELSSTTALEQANAMQQRGDYRGAVRYLYLSSLLWLDEHKLLRYDRSRTNREYLAQVHDNVPLRERLTPVVSTFDRVWYGKRPIDGDELRAYQEQIDALRREEPPV